MKRRIIDLSLDIYHDYPVHPEDPRVGFLTFSTIEKHGCNMTQIILSSHCSTHMDAPYHFIESGRSIDNVDLEKCIGEAVVIDLSHRETKGDITVEEIKKYENKIQKGSRMLIRSDWHKMFGQEEYYTSFSGVGAELAEWLASKEIHLIGVETPAIHPTDYETVHKTLLSKEIVIVEGLANLDQLAKEDVFFTALPLKFKGRDGSPVRAIAIEQ